MLGLGTSLKYRYRIDALIGSGGYATVYRVTDLNMGLERALKEVTDPDSAIREQFALEAQLLMTSNHPNIPRGYEHFEENGRAYLVMDYVGGKDLEQILSDSLMREGRPLDEAQVLRWLLPICDALEVMHTRIVPIIHRDIKPANIKLNAGGAPILIDFGLAKLARPGPTNQAAQGVTPGYAPPEQYLALGKTDARSDVYGLGATLYTLVTGREPSEATNRLLAQSGNTGQPLVPARVLNPMLSASTAHIIDRAMDVSATMRYQSAREMRDEMVNSLDHLLYGRPPYESDEPNTGPITVSRPAQRSAASGKPVRPAASVPVKLPAHSTLFLGEPARRLTPSKHLIQSLTTPWFDLGGPLVRRMGKVGIFLAAVELYWGLLCAGALGSVVGTNDFTHFPSLLVLAGGIAWVIVVILLTVLLVRALDRPIARRGRLSGLRRWLQGILLSLIWLGMNGIAYLSLNSLTAEEGLFGLGLLGLASILAGLLSVANILA